MVNRQQIIENTFGTEYIINCHDEVHKPLVSIIIPTKNCLIYLPTAINSIQNQLVDDVEIIIVDDNSTDDSWDYLTLAASCDKRILAFKIVNGGSVAKVRNFALQKAQAKYIAFLDADDYWLPSKLSKQLAFHNKHPKVTLSFCNYVHLKEKKQFSGDCFSYWPLFNRHINRAKKSDYKVLNKGAAVIYAENVIGTSGVLLNTEALSLPIKFDENITSAEDWDLWIKIALSGPIAFTTCTDLVYLMRANSESAKVKLRLQQIKKIMLRYKKDIFYIKPVALIQCTARLITGYAEYYRNTSFGQQRPTLKVTSLLVAFLCHSMALLLSPSKKAFKATLSDVKNIIIRK
jgi:glycosyltransferase involved in cell wall biosynthesis